MSIDRAKVQKQGESYIAAGKTDRAIDEFLKLLEDRPSDLLMVNRIGDLYLQAGKIRDALDMFKRAGMGYERDGFIPKATAVFKKAHRTAPEDTDIAIHLADLYRQTNLIKDAIQIHIEVAELFTKKGLLKRALEEFAQVVELDPKNLKNKVKLADLYNKEGMKERAASIYLEVAETLAIDQLHGEASQILERAKAMISTPQVYLTQSRLGVIQKDLEGAANYLREGLEANPRDPELLEALAEIELQSKRPEKALEALGQIPQLAEKAMQLCERALREMVKGGAGDTALLLFKPIGREFGRRGHGEVAVKALQMAFQGRYPLEAWIQLAELAHQSGQKQEHIDALQNARAMAQTEGQNALAEELGQKLTTLGVALSDQPPPPPSPAPHPSFSFEHPTAPGMETTEIDPLRRMQIDQLQRDAEGYLHSRFMDKAQECYSKILELEPTHRDAIERIADIIRASGKMTAVQVHYVKVAERLAGLGLRPMAVEMLDKAEALFPGSTRMYRRTLGLLDVPPSAPPAPLPVVAAAPEPLPIALPAGIPDMETEPLIPLEESPYAPSEPTAPTLAQDLNAIIGLDDRSQVEIAQTPLPEVEPLPFQALAPTESIPAALPAFLEPLPPTVPAGEVPFALLEPLPEALPPTAELPGLPEDFTLVPSDLDWHESVTAPEEPEPLELEPLSFATHFPEAPEAAPAEPVLPSTAPVPENVDEELASLLSDIDFQLDYGSMEEAKAEIQNALELYPNHGELLRRLETADAALHRMGHTHKLAPEEESELSHSFFDLSDVLGNALIETGEGEEMHDATNVVEKIQSVDELFNAFREGVEQQVKGDDYDTHYNLGIAYKEMMLLEPAMEEFKKAMNDPERTLECCSMLSICEQTQGDLDAATAWLNQGIDAPGFPPEDAIGLRYDLGEILLQQGRNEEAAAQFHRVYDLDPDYRDVASKLS